MNVDTIDANIKKIGWIIDMIYSPTLDCDIVDHKKSINISTSDVNEDYPKILKKIME